MVAQNKLKFMGLFCLLLPFMQVGFTYYMSIQLLLFMIFLLNCSIKELKIVGMLLLLLAPVMVFPALIASQGSLFHTFLLAMRECTFLSLLLAIGILSRTYQCMHKEYIKYLLLFFLSVIVLQSIALANGNVLVLPSSFLSSNRGTLEGLEFALSLGFHDIVRPSAFYGEPSFLSFICISLFYIVLVNDAFSSTERKYYTGVVLLTFLLSQSLSGVLALFVLLAAASLRHIDNTKNILIMLMGVITLLSFLIFFEDLWVVQRILAIVSLDGSDSSFMTRFMVPFTLIERIFQDYPFGGVTRDLLIAVYASADDQIVQGVDNGFFNIFVTYGYFGFVVWGCIVAVFFRNPMALLYLMLASMFNGSFFSIDKLSMIGMTMMLASSTISQGKHWSARKVS